MMKETRSGICLQGGTAPLEVALEKVAPEVRLNLHPLQGGKRKMDIQEGFDHSSCMYQVPVEKGCVCSPLCGLMLGTL